MYYVKRAMAKAGVRITDAIVALPMRATPKSGNQIEMYLCKSVMPKLHRTLVLAEYCITRASNLSVALLLTSTHKGVTKSTFMKVDIQVGTYWEEASTQHTTYI